jgi:methionyl-tRNA formyltransferase
MKIRLLFIATDYFAIPALQKFLQSDDFQLVGVVTQPDRPAGRKQVLTPPPVKQFLLDQNIDVKIWQPEKLRDQAKQILDKAQPELIIVTAYGQMVPNEMIDYPKHKCLNIHGSLLPMYRGAVPIEMALLNGDKTTGVSILEMTPGLDDGPVLAEEEVGIKLEDDAVSLRQDLSERGAKLMSQILPRWLKGELQAISQDTLAREKNRILSICRVTDLSREQAEIDPTGSVETAWNKVRGFANSRGAWLKTHFNGKPVELKIWKAEIISHETQERYWSKPKFIDGKLILNFPDGQLSLITLQLSGKNIGGPKEYKFLDDETK